MAADLMSVSSLRSIPQILLDFQFENNLSYITLILITRVPSLHLRIVSKTWLLPLVAKLDELSKHKKCSIVGKAKRVPGEDSFYIVETNNLQKLIKRSVSNLFHEKSCLHSRYTLGGCRLE